jgi:hypothetical protein
MVPVASSTSLAAKVAPTVTLLAAVKAEEQDTVQEVSITPEPSSEEELAHSTPPTTPPTASSSPSKSDSSGKERRKISKKTRFSELETIKSNVSEVIEISTPTELARENDEKRRPASVVTALPTNFDEGSLPAPTHMALPPPKPGKLSKNPGSGAKLAKKNRWSLRSSKSAVAAG